MESSPAACCSTYRSGKAFRTWRMMSRFTWKTWRLGRRRPASAWTRATPGLYASCARWLRERGASILGSDAVQDVRPSRVEGVNQPIHQMALVAMGMPLTDNADLEALSEAAAGRRRWTYLLTINPLRVPGATGGPVNPIAIF